MILEEPLVTVGGGVGCGTLALGLPTAATLSYWLWAEKAEDFLIVSRNTWDHKHNSQQSEIRNKITEQNLNVLDNI